MNSCTKPTPRTPREIVRWDADSEDVPRPCGESGDGRVWPRHLRKCQTGWKKLDTKDNIFYWLDYGAGKNIELEFSPREGLVREKVCYLWGEEKEYYLVRTDDDGKCAGLRTALVSIRQRSII